MEPLMVSTTTDSKSHGLSREYADLLSFPLETSDPEPVKDVTKVLEEKDRKDSWTADAVYVIDGVFIALTLLEEGIFRDKDNTSAREIMARKMKLKCGSKTFGIEVPSKISYTFQLVWKFYKS